MCSIVGLAPQRLCKRGINRFMSQPNHESTESWVANLANSGLRSGQDHTEHFQPHAKLIQVPSVDNHLHEMKLPSTTEYGLVLYPWRKLDVYVDARIWLQRKTSWLQEILPAKRWIHRLASAMMRLWFPISSYTIATIIVAAKMPTQARRRWWYCPSDSTAIRQTCSIW
jgi:hypothetical protein